MASVPVVESVCRSKMDPVIAWELAVESVKILNWYQPEMFVCDLLSLYRTRDRYGTRGHNTTEEDGSRE